MIPQWQVSAIKKIGTARNLPKRPERPVETLRVVSSDRSSSGERDLPGLSPHLPAAPELDRQ